MRDQEREGAWLVVDELHEIERMRWGGDRNVCFAEWLRRSAPGVEWGTHAVHHGGAFVATTRDRPAAERVAARFELAWPDRHVMIDEPDEGLWRVSCTLTGSLPGMLNRAARRAAARARGKPDPEWIAAKALHLADEYASRKHDERMTPSTPREQTDDR